MKISSDRLFQKINSEKIDFRVVLFFGNEEGLISQSIKYVSKYFEKKENIKEIVSIDYKKQKDASFLSSLANQSLFSDNKIIVIQNPNENFLDEIQVNQVEKNVVLINGFGIKAASKIKKFFDYHNMYFSVSCYELKRAQKINIIDRFLKQNSISLRKNTYWFLVENVSDEFLILEKELEKVLIFNKPDISIKEMGLLLVNKNSADSDNVFFNCCELDYGALLKKSYFLINSSTGGYEILMSIKKFIQILSSALIDREVNGPDGLVEKYLPKYLFLKKESFREIIKKTNLEKINKVNHLIQKTELLLRKNISHQAEITERFLLNCSKILK